MADGFLQRRAATRADPAADAPASAAGIEPRRIVGLAYPGVLLLDLVGPLEVFNLAAEILREDVGIPFPLYRVEIWGAGKGDVRTMSHLSVLATQAIGDDLQGVDTILIPGAGTGQPQIHRDRRVLDWLRAASGRVRRIASGCSGSFVLAEAGLLHGRRATAHWRDAETFKRFYPAVSIVKDATFIKDGPIYTSAGATAGIDLALALVEEDFGRAISLKIAKRIVVFARRPGEQAQLSSVLASQTKSVRFGDLIDWIYRSLRADLSVARLAEIAAMSPRNFTRVFCSEIGMAPAEFVRTARVEIARRMIAEGAGMLGGVARECGFASQKQMRRAFLATLRMSPRQYAQDSALRSRIESRAAKSLA